MTKRKKAEVPQGIHLWDEIAKGIAEKMPGELIPVINEVFGKDYPPDAKVTFLSTEYVKPRKKEGHAYPLILSDITFQVEGGEVYHLEFQMNEDNTISVRMMEYDFSIALQHGISEEKAKGFAAGEASDLIPKGAAAGEASDLIPKGAVAGDGSEEVFHVRFPHSAVIYPAASKEKPDHLTCILHFQDGSEHAYRIPVVKVCDYPLSELFEKRLNMFLPFSVLRFRGSLEKMREKSGDGKGGDEGDDFREELRAFWQEFMAGLEEEFRQGKLAEWQYGEYMRLVRLAGERVFRRYGEFWEEAEKMTKRKLKFFSDYIEEYKEEIAKQKTEIAQQKAEIEALKRQIEQLKSAT